MVLHSLGDRMIVYPFFLLYGLLVGSWEQVKDTAYIPEVTKKHSSSKKKPSKKKKRKQKRKQK
jgi:hypothetical protein